MWQKLINFFFPVETINPEEVYSRLYTSLEGWQNGKLRQRKEL